MRKQPADTPQPLADKRRLRVFATCQGALLIILSPQYVGISPLQWEIYDEIQHGDCGPFRRAHAAQLCAGG